MERPRFGDEARALLVDDEPDICWVLDKALQGIGVRTVSAGSGREALEALGRYRILLAIVDAKLPDMDGCDLVKAIRRASTGIAIIMVSGYYSSDDAQIRRTLETGETRAFFSKPFLVEELQRCVKDNL